MHDLLGVASKGYPAVLGIYVKLLRGRSEIVEERSQDTRTDSPFVLRNIPIKQRVLNIGRLVVQLVCFSYSWHVGKFYHNCRVIAVLAYHACKSSLQQYDIRYWQYHPGWRLRISQQRCLCL